MRAAMPRAARRAPVAANRYARLEKRMARTSLFAHLDAGRPDDRPPLFDLGLVECGEPFGRLLLACGNVQTEIGESRAHRGVGERLHHRAIELRDDLLRRSPGREQAEPA